MQFEQGHIHHIYNQGNNRYRIFFNRRNYLFFLRKMRKHLLPYGDLIAYCLMPNHFHWMMVVRQLSVRVARSDMEENARFINPMTQSHRINEQMKVKEQSLNQSIAILLRSYTRAINNEQERSGSLFRQKTKAECLTLCKGITPSFFNTQYGTLINTPLPENKYPQRCFDYIHNNPVKAGLVKRAEDWEFSSYRDYYLNRNGTLINKKAAKEFGIILNKVHSSDDFK